MTAYLKDLIAGVLAWWSMNGAYKLFPVKELAARGLGEGMTLLLFKPIELIISVSLFLIASLLWGKPFVGHFLRLTQRPLSMDSFLHLMMCGYFSLIAYIQYVKMPARQLYCLIFLLLFSIIKLIRRRALYTEITQLTRKK